LPKKQPLSVGIDRSALQATTKRVLLAADKTRALQLRFSSGSLTISSKTMGSSESRENISLEGYEGEDCHLAVNGKFFSDVFTTTASDQLELKFKDEDNPIVIIPTVEPQDCQSQHVLVPIKESN
jgi:DNA polymerase III sliding clamp (beta) subunit (PCNA family)